MEKVLGKKVGHLWIKECGVESCKYDTKRWHYHRLNPRGGAMKAIEMTVFKALKIIEGFDEVVERFGKEADWTSVDLTVYRKVFGLLNPTGRELPELWERYKKGTLHREVLALAENLHLDDLSADRRKEIGDAIKRIRAQVAR